MRWKKAAIATGIMGATVCGACLARTVTKSSTVSSETCATDESNSSLLKELTLKQVHVYFRHGARTPIHVIPGVEQVAYDKDIMLRTPSHLNFDHQVVFLPDLTPRGDLSEMEQHYKKTSLKGGSYAGNLTTYGQEQMYSLGLRLRKAYVQAHHLLSDGYQPEEVFVQSTNIDRTIASARCVMAGLFGKDSLNRHGPVKIPVLRSPEEMMYPNSRACSVTRKANHASMIHFDNIPGIKEDRLAIEKVLGYDTDQHTNFVFLRDDLVARVAHGYRIPAHIRPYMDMIERNATKILYFALCGQHEAERPVVTRLAAGPILNMMMTGIDSMLQGAQTPKIYLYSIHDSSLIVLLEAFCKFDWKWPPFSADVRVEVYEDKAGQHWVRLLYQGQEKTVRNCSGPVCRLSEFRKNMAPYIIAKGPEYEKICASQILEQIAASLVQHDKDEVETPEMKEVSEIPAGM